MARAVLLALLLVALVATPATAQWTNPPPEVVDVTRTATGTTVTIDATATDNYAVATVEMAVLDKQTGQWLHPDGTWGAFRWLEVFAHPDGSRNETEQVTFTFDATAGEYGTGVRARDLKWNWSDPVWGPVTVDPHVGGCDADQTATLTDLFAQGGTVTLDGCYLIEDAVEITVPVTVEGNGATLRRVGPTAEGSKGGPHLDIVADDVTIRNLTIDSWNDGSVYRAGDRIEYDGQQITVDCWPDYTGCYESVGQPWPPYTPRFGNEAGIYVRGDNVTIDAVTVADVWGDGLSIHTSANVDVDRVTVDRNGRQGVWIGTATDVDIDNLVVTGSRLFGIDFEHATATDVTIGPADTTSWWHAVACVDQTVERVTVAPLTWQSPYGRYWPAQCTGTVSFTPGGPGGK